MRHLRLFILLVTVVMFPLGAANGPGPGGGGGKGGGGKGGGGGRGADDIVTPEPATWVLMATGVAGVLVRAHLKSRKKT